MKKCLFISFLICFSSVFSQDYTGNWSGLLIETGEDLNNAKVIYVKVKEEGDNLQGLTRIEILDHLDFTAKFFKGKVVGKELTITEEQQKRSSHTRNAPECKLNYRLTYHDSTGYLKGKYRSTDCRHVRGRVVLFRSDHVINIEKEPTSTHLWTHRFIENYKKGYPAPEILAYQKEHFQFHPIYFDFDSSRIHPKYYAYLDKMIQILDVFTDLRVKITGHTDAIGTNNYNVGLSERRADAIRDFFEGRGINKGKLEINFKGEIDPAATNKTSDGRHLNRRVVFDFI